MPLNSLRSLRLCSFMFCWVILYYQRALARGAVCSKSKGGGAHCTEIDFALSFGGVMVKMIDLSKNGTRDFFGIILD